MVHIISKIIRDSLDMNPKPKAKVAPTKGQPKYERKHNTVNAKRMLRGVRK